MIHTNVIQPLNGNRPGKPFATAGTTYTRVQDVVENETKESEETKEVPGESGPLLYPLQDEDTDEESGGEEPNKSPGDTGMDQRRS